MIMTSDLNAISEQVEFITLSRVITILTESLSRPGISNAKQHGVQ